MATNEEEKAKEEEKAEKQKEKLVTQAKALIDSGMDPKQVGAMLMGLGFAQNGGGMVMPQSDGMDSIEKFAKIISIMDSRNGTSKLELAIEKLESKFEARMEKLAEDKTKRSRDDDRDVSPGKKANSALAEMSEWRKIMIEMGIVADPREVRDALKAGSNKGKTIEEIKEENRHAEEKEKLQAEREYKQGLVSSIAGIEERIGKGIASQLRESGSIPSGGASKMSHMRCSHNGCGYDIIYPPDALQVKCPKCNMVYQRDVKVPARPQDEEVPI